METIATVGSTNVYRANNAFHFTSAMSIDGDGAYRAYHPSNRGLDWTANAGHPGNWWAIVTRGGVPVVQGPDDPAPGYYVSTTALEDPNYSRGNPLRYVDSESIPYVVLPPQVSKAGGAALGDFAMVINVHNWQATPAIFADIGPKKHLGEASIQTAKRLGIPSSPKNGGTEARCIFYVVFPDSGNHLPRTLEEIEEQGSALFTAWGGMEEAKRVLSVH